MESNTLTGLSTENEIAEGTKHIVNKVLRIDPSEFQISDDSNLFELGLESLNVIELITELELAYRITIDVEDLSQDLFSRFGMLVAFMQTKLRALH